MMNNPVGTNVAKIIGVIVTTPHLETLQGLQFLKFRVEIVKNSGKKNCLPVITPLDDFTKTLSMGMRVSIIGKIKPYRKQVNSRSRLLLQISATKISISSKRDKNLICLSGFISKQPQTFQDNMKRSFTISMLSIGDNKTYIPIKATGSNVLLLRELSQGTRVEITGPMEPHEYERFGLHEQTHFVLIHKISVL